MSEFSASGNDASPSLLGEPRMCASEVAISACLRTFGNFVKKKVYYNVRGHRNDRTACVENYDEMTIFRFRYRKESGTIKINVYAFAYAKKAR